LHREDAKKDQEIARDLEQKVNQLDAQLSEREKEMNAIKARRLQDQTAKKVGLEDASVQSDRDDHKPDASDQGNVGENTEQASQGFNPYRSTHYDMSRGSQLQGTRPQHGQVQHGRDDPNSGQPQHTASKHTIRPSSGHHPRPQPEGNQPRQHRQGQVQTDTAFTDRPPCGPAMS